MLKIKKDDFKINQVIWGKISGYPWWPCFIKNIKKEEIEVCYLGDFSRSFLKIQNIRNFSEIKKPFKPGKKLLKSIKIAKSIINGNSSIEKELKKAHIIFEDDKKFLDCDLKTEIETNVFEIRKIDVNRENKRLSDKEETGDENNFKSSKKKKKKKKEISRKKISFQFPLFSEKKEIKIVNIENIEIEFGKLIEKIILGDLKFFFDYKFEKLFNSILKMDNKILFNSKIGKYVNCLFDFCQKKLNEDKNFEKIYNILKLEIEKIRNKLISGFFKVKKDQKKKNSENFKFIKKSIRKNIKGRNIKIKTKFKKEKKNENKKKIFENQMSERVSKKICKIIFLNKGDFFIQKKNCQIISFIIEDFIKKESKSQIDYKMKVIKFIQFLNKNPIFIKNFLSKNINSENSVIYETINRIINY